MFNIFNNRTIKYGKYKIKYKIKQNQLEGLFSLIKENTKINNYDGKVPNNREYLESLPGVGHKTTNVVLANLYGISAFAVDTHVMRVSKRLGIADENDSVLKIEEKINKFFPKENWNKLNDQFILFGRYYCKAQNPKCEECPFKDFCKYKKVI